MMIIWMKTTETLNQVSIICRKKEIITMTSSMKMIIVQKKEKQGSTRLKTKEIPAIQFHLLTIQVIRVMQQHKAQLTETETQKRTRRETPLKSAEKEEGKVRITRQKIEKEVQLGEKPEEGSIEQNSQTQTLTHNHRMKVHPADTLQGLLLRHTLFHLPSKEQHNSILPLHPHPLH